MILEFEYKGELFKVSIDEKKEKFSISIENINYDVDCKELSENCLSILIGIESYTIFYAKSNKKIHIFVKGQEYIFETAPKEKIKTSGTDFLEQQDNLIYAPMPGKILKIMVKEGEKVKKKQSLVIVEAMKMEHDIRSPFEAVIKKVNFKEGQMVNTDSPLIELIKAAN